MIDLNVSATVQLFAYRARYRIVTSSISARALCMTRRNGPVMKVIPSIRCTLRRKSFTDLFDGGDRLFPSLLRHALSGKPFSISPGTQLRDFCSVQDVTEAICLILEQGTQLSRDIFNVGSGRSISLKDIVLDVVHQLGINVDLRFGDLPFHPHEPMQLVADIGRMESVGWRPRTNLAYAVWQLAQTQFPELHVTRPEELL